MSMLGVSPLIGLQTLGRRPAPQADTGGDWTQLLDAILETLRSTYGQQERSQATAEERAGRDFERRKGQVGNLTDTQKAHLMKSPYPTQALGISANINAKRRIAAMGIRPEELPYIPQQQEGETDSEYESRVKTIHTEHQAQRSAAIAKNRQRTARDKLRKGGKPGRGYVVTEQSDQRSPAERARLATDYRQGRRTPAAAGAEGTRQMQEASFAIDNPSAAMLPKRPSTYTGSAYVEGQPTFKSSAYGDVAGARGAAQGAMQQMLGQDSEMQKARRLIANLVGGLLG